MIFLNIIIVFINIFILTVLYFVLKRKFDSRYLNKTVLDNAKKELNNFMRSINDATLNNCNVIEAKVEDLKKIIEKADLKIKEIESLLRIEFNKNIENVANENASLPARQVVSPNKMLANYRKKNQLSEKVELDTEKIEQLKKEMEKMDLSEKIRFLYNKKIPDVEIKKILALPSGEFEVLFNVMNMDDKF
ncbi:MAG: hypothetical protein UHW86_01035 [Spirochaetota bacterium]|nr:hypothetical protein [Spirochaetota bacterium]